MIGVLALQGNFFSHIQILNKLGYDSKLVKSSKDLDDISSKSSFFGWAYNKISKAAAAPCFPAPIIHTLFIN